MRQGISQIIRGFVAIIAIDVWVISQLKKIIPENNPFFVALNFIDRVTSPLHNLFHKFIENMPATELMHIISIFVLLILIYDFVFPPKKKSKVLIFDE